MPVVPPCSGVGKPFQYDSRNFRYAFVAPPVLYDGKLPFSNGGRRNGRINRENEGIFADCRNDKTVSVHEQRSALVRIGTTDERPGGQFLFSFAPPFSDKVIFDSMKIRPLTADLPILFRIG